MEESLSVIVPARNETKNLHKIIPPLISELEKEKIEFEVIIVNDNSLDDTQAVSQKLSFMYPKIRVVKRAMPFGFGRALKDGFKESKGKVIIPFMADGSDDPADLVRLYRKILEGYDLVYGSRFMKGGRVYHYPILKLIINRIANHLLKIIFKIDNSDITNAFKAIRREALVSLMPLEATEFNITLEIPLKARIKNVRHAFMPVSWKGRDSGVSNLRVINLIKYYKQYFFTLKNLVAFGIKQNFF
ncbi:MAG: glycosyltransferase family 2 protein [Candidatus Omnitrophota bacterium]|nr:glycosyltransferase family 2 protein [Candidatus Omnitrophota bacterium]